VQVLETIDPRYFYEATSRTTKDATNNNKPQRRVRECQTAINTKGRTHARVRPACRVTLPR
jgi:hypothetical protein